jgi:hypothetical protein
MRFLAWLQSKDGKSNEKETLQNIELAFWWNPLGIWLFVESLPEGGDNTLSITNHLTGIAMMTLIAAMISIA